MLSSNGRCRLISRTLAVVVVTVAALMMLAETTTAQNRGAQQGQPGPSDTDTRPYNKRDFGGLWTHNPGLYELPACRECGEQNPIRIPGYGYFGDVPPRTPQGEKILQSRKHGRGFEPDAEAAKQYPNLDPAYKRAGLPAFSNDPEASCDMMGLARSIVMSGPNSNMEMVHTQANDRIIQNFEWYADHRTIWMDGRKLPEVGGYLAGVNGYSVGQWEGDTLVVTSTGFDDRQWVDMYGFPISEDAILVERWEHPSPNRLRVQVTLTDPANYTRPWTSTVKTWALVPKEKMVVGGWSGLLEDRCIPADENEFNQFRNRAAGVEEK